MAEQIAKFRFIKYRILESSIKTNLAQDSASQLSVNFKQTVGVDEGNHKMRLLFDTEIADEKKNIEIMVKAEGFFEFEQGLPEEQKERFFKINAPAILFPYVRAYISTLTALSGINPITLPTLNLSQR